MIRFIVAVTVILLLAASNQAATALQKSYGYRYGSAKDTGSDREYVICDETHRSPLVPQLKADLAIRGRNIRCVLYNGIFDPVLGYIAKKHLRTA